MTPDICAAIGQYKSRLRSGERGPLVGPRQTGRTTAMLEYAHELCHQGKYVVFQTHNARMVLEMTRRYRELTHDCLVCTITNIRRGGVNFPKFIGPRIEPEIEDMMRGRRHPVLLCDVD